MNPALIGGIIGERRFLCLNCARIWKDITCKRSYYITGKAEIQPSFDYAAR